MQLFYGTRKCSVSLVVDRFITVCWPFWGGRKELTLRPIVNDSGAWWVGNTVIAGGMNRYGGEDESGREKGVAVGSAPSLWRSCEVPRHSPGPRELIESAGTDFR